MNRDPLGMGADAGAVGEAVHEVEVVEQDRPLEAQLSAPRQARLDLVSRLLGDLGPGTADALGEEPHHPLDEGVAAAAPQPACLAAALVEEPVGDLAAVDPSVAPVGRRRGSAISPRSFCG